ncbi:hypothetical protein ElyMa_005686400 [Elysia marginata]|uniref:Uncharacterized protein n=1 Tax=Elysia marginata TaxID=1093978 RepID=A0AAV4FG81_9GAST|nr:hypothetical protein ElyMa_005686400 [Elysia marginata]
MQCGISGYEVEMHNGDSYFGLLDSKEGCPPYNCLERSLSMISKFAVLIIDPKTMPNASAIIKDENNFYIFDPHNRSVDGMACSEGVAVLTTHRSLQEVKEFLLSLACSIGHSPCPFELTLVSVAISTSDSVYHNLHATGPSNWNESSDSDVPLARI